MNHLSDPLIQEYLDGNLDRIENMRVKMHADECKACAQKIARYQRLFQDISHEQDFDLPANFTRRVIAQVKKSSLGARPFNLTQILLWFAGAITCINTLLYYVDWQPIAEDLKTSTDYLPNIQVNVVNETIQQSKSFVEGLNLNLILLFMAVVVLIVLFALDKFLARHKEKLV